MTKLNAIQDSIKRLSEGEYQKLMDIYLHKRYNFNNITPLGSHDGTNKTTKGTPDSYVKLDNSKYILIMHGTVERNTYSKLKNDIQDCLDIKKVKLNKDRIKKIICCYASSNLPIDKEKELTLLGEGIEIEIINLGTVSYDLYNHYPKIAEDILNVSVDTGQILTIDDFVELYDSNQLNSPLNLKLWNREKEISKLKKLILNNNLIMVSGSAGLGKTRLVIEILRDIENTFEDYKIYCIKGRGLPIYKDLKDYIYKSGNYILFVDDANEMNDLEYILEYLNNTNDGISVKIILTVRDYAKEFVEKILSKVSNYEEYKLGIMENKDIENILKRNFNIENNIFLERILEISKGNIRMATMAAKIALEHGFEGIQNPVDIFKYYYQDIIEDELRTENNVLIKSLFIISLLGPLDYKEDKNFLKILNYFNINMDLFHNSCIELNNLELVDLYKDKVAKINDQNMRDYLLYYILIDKKYVPIIGLFNKDIYLYKDKILESISIILNIFPSEETFEFIKNNVINYAETLSAKERYRFSKDLIVFDQEWILLYIKEQIEKLDKNIVDLRKFNFKSKMNYKIIKSEYVQILSKFRYMKHRDIAVDLILYLFEKNIQNPMDFYFVFTENYGYDEKSHLYNYELENLVINKLWKLTSNGKNINATILLIYVISNYLEYNHDVAKNIENYKGVFITFYLIKNDGLIKLRKKMWWILGQLYKMENYRSKIERVLLDYNMYSMNNSENNLKEILRLDIKLFKKYILSQISEITFIQSDIIYNFNSISKRILKETSIEINDVGLNKNYNLYLTLTKPNDGLEGWEKEEKNIKENIEIMLKKYNKEEFNDLFKNLRKIEELNHVEGHNYWRLSNGVWNMFKLLEGNQYVMAVESYLINNTPYGLTPQFVLPKLLKICGEEKTWRIINAHEYSSKNIWLLEYVLALPRKKLTMKIIRKFKLDLINGVKENEKINLFYMRLIKFVDYDKAFIFDVGYCLLEKKINPQRE